MSCGFDGLVLAVFVWYDKFGWCMLCEAEMYQDENQ